MVRMKPMQMAGRTGKSWQVAIAGTLLIGVLIYSLKVSHAAFDNFEQMCLGWGCFTAVLVMYVFKGFRRQPWRLVFILISVFLALRYMQWRTADTLIYTGPMDFIGMALLYLAEIYGLLIYLLGMFVNFSPMESKHVPLPEEADKLPTVDIFIPTYNESDDIIRITATAATQIDYPKEKLRVYILDDGGTQAKRSHPETGMAAWERHYRLREMAADLGIGYLTRETNQQAKAGNINHALEYTDGDLLLILDCDHVPTKDILQYTVGHFLADPKLFLVQTPHFFINPTPIDKNLEAITSLPGENDMFYRRIHPALNFWNASYFCGSAALLRRKYLQEVGGICGSTITEDAETSFHLHSRGYNSIYVNRPMVCGLSPESYEDYVIQRSRWAQGMVQLILLYSPLKTKGLSLAQKIAYFNSSLFWFFGFPRFIYFIAPASYLLFGLNVYHASWTQIVAFTLPYVLSIYLVMDFFYAGSRQPFFSEIYESVQSLFLIPVVLSVLVNPLKPSFKVTPKGLTNEKDYLSPLSAPFFLVIGVNLAALMLAGIRWFTEPFLRHLIIATSVWTVYNLYLALMSLGAFWEHRQIRKFYRIGDGGQVTAYFPRMGTSHSGEVHDVSLTGIGFAIQLPFVPSDQEEVVLEVRDSYGRSYRFESRIHRAVRRRGRLFCGSEFITGVSYTDVVSYVFGDSRRWQENWNRRALSRGTFRTLWHFLVAGIRGFMAGILPLFVVGKGRWIGDSWFTLAVLRNILAAVSIWCVYYLYSAAALAVKMLDRKQVRKIERISTSEEVAIYIPRLDATVIGQLRDLSLTGAGIVAELPFELKGRERITIRRHGRDGGGWQFECYVLRTIKRDAKSLCGAEFVVDLYSYPKIVKFVYGGSLPMLRDLLMPGLIADGKSATRRYGALALGIFIRVFSSLAQALALLFMMPVYRAAYPKGRRVEPQPEKAHAPTPPAPPPRVHRLALPPKPSPLQFRARRALQPLKLILARHFFPPD